VDQKASLGFAIGARIARLGKLIYMYTYCMIFVMYGMIGCCLFCFKFPLFRVSKNFSETAWRLWRSTKRCM